MGFENSHDAKSSETMGNNTGGGVQKGKASGKGSAENFPTNKGEEGTRRRGCSKKAPPGGQGLKKTSQL